MQKLGSKFNKLSSLVFKQFATLENKLNFKNITALLRCNNGIFVEFCLIYEDWWLFETKAFYALREKAKIG